MDCSTVGGRLLFKCPETQSWAVMLLLCFCAGLIIPYKMNIV